MHGRTAIALALSVTLAGCAGTGEPSDDPTSPEPSTTAGAPTVVEPTTALLDWKPTGVAPGDRHVRGDGAEIRVESGNALARVDFAGGSVEIPAGPGRTISEVLLSEDWAVVVRQDSSETAPSKVALVDLAAQLEALDL